jgi:hypothetical protein
LGTPFDDSVLVWHIATDICFYDSSRGADAWNEESPYHMIATRCREMSDYMFYLLVACPEMLMAGTRASIFPAVHEELREGELTREIYRRAQQVWPDAVLTKESFVLRASDLAYQLLDMDDDKRWRVI